MKLNPQPPTYIGAFMPLYCISVGAMIEVLNCLNFHKKSSHETLLLRILVGEFLVEVLQTSLVNLLLLHAYLTNFIIAVWQDLTAENSALCMFLHVQCNDKCSNH